MSAVRKQPTGDRLRELLARYTAGETIAALGPAFGVCGTIIHRILVREGVPRRSRTRKPIGDGLTATQRRDKRLRSTEEGRAVMRREDIRNICHKKGLSVDRYDAIRVAQDGGCAVCRRTPPFGIKARLVIDHCHASGRVRGLLCNDCNVILGLANDSPDRLLAVLEYLVRTTADATDLRDRVKAKRITPAGRAALSGAL